MPQKFKTEEAAEYVGLPVKTVQHAARSGRLAYYTPGPRGPWYFDPADLDAWLESMRVPADTTRP